MLFDLRLWLGEHLYGVIGDPKSPAGYRVSSKRIVKWLCETPELDGHLFAAMNTDIPIPHIYRTRMWRGKLAIEMEYFPHCETLQRCWRSLSSKTKQEIVRKVSGYIQQLHSIEPPPDLRGKVSATRGGARRDIRISPSKLFGPFDDIAGFHRCVRGGVEPDGVRGIFGEKVADMNDRSWAVRFTHGDLGVQNILMRDGKVVAILDWERSEWYPEYWEYTKAHCNSVLLPEFYQMLRQHIPRYDEKLAAERTLWRCFDQPLDTPIN